MAFLSIENDNNINDKDVYFGKTFENAIFSERIPILGQLEITRLCPFTCKFCYAEPIANKSPITTIEIFKTLEQVADAGCCYLLLTGGEPLFHKDFISIYKRVVDLGIQPYVETNAYNLNSEMIKLFKEYPPVHIAVSLYAYTGEAYKAITGVNNSRNVVFSNVDILIDSIPSLSLRTPICKINFSEIEMLLDFSKKRSLNHSMSFHLFPKQNGDNISKDYAFTISELKQTCKEISCNNIVKDRIKQFLSSIERPPKTNCYDGVASFYINAYSELVFCTYLWNHSISLRNYSFNDAWRKRCELGLHYKNGKYHCKHRNVKGHCNYWKGTVQE